MNQNRPEINVETETLQNALESSPTRFTMAATPGCKHHRARPSAATQSQPSRLRPLPSPQTKLSLAPSTPRLLCHGQRSPPSLVTQRCWPSVSPGSVRCPLSPGRSQECRERRAVGRHGRPRWWRGGVMRAARSRTQTLRTTNPHRQAQSARFCDKCFWEARTCAVRVTLQLAAPCCRRRQLRHRRLHTPQNNISTLPSAKTSSRDVSTGGCAAHGAWAERVGRRLDAPRRR